MNSEAQTGSLSDETPIGLTALAANATPLQEISDKTVLWQVAQNARKAAQEYAHHAKFLEAQADAIERILKSTGWFDPHSAQSDRATLANALQESES